NVSYEVIQPGEMRLELYDMLGKQVRFMEQGFVYEGNYSVEFPVSDIDAGMYILIINTGESQIANKIKIVK
ncbi:MAG: T9SS type A sorting domain-containing protein, partial [Bacteroidales bacterium]